MKRIKPVKERVLITLDEGLKEKVKKIIAPNELSTYINSKLNELVNRKK